MQAEPKTSLACAHGSRSEVPVRTATGARRSRARRWSEWARHAEDLGYSTIYVPDHFVDHPLAPIPTMAAVAASTTTLRVGSLVLGNDYKHPVVVAKEAATIDVLSNGRLELGHRRRLDDRRLRAGGHPARPRPACASRGWPSRSRSSRDSWADGPFSFAGEHYTVTGLDGDPEAGAAAAPAARHRRRRPEGARVRGARGRHRRHQREPARRHAQRPEHGAVDEPGVHRREAAVGARRRGRSLRRPRDPGARRLRPLHRRRSQPIAR